MTAPVPTIASPRGTYTGVPLCRPRSGERFYQCPICGGWVDGTDIHQVIEHEGGVAPAPAIAMPVAQAS